MLAATDNDRSLGIHYRGRYVHLCPDINLPLYTSDACKLAKLKWGFICLTKKKKSGDLFVVHINSVSSYDESYYGGP